MTTDLHTPSAAVALPHKPNGAGAATLLSASIGAFALGIFTVLGDKVPSLRKLFIFNVRTGPLSGVTTLAILLWLLSWVGLHMAWKRRDMSLKPVVAAAFVMLALSLLLTFPPVIDLF